MIYEFSTNLRSKYSLVKKGKSKRKTPNKLIFSTYKIYAKITEDGSVNFEIAKFTGYNYNKMKDISLSKLKGFSGTINYTDIKGQNLKSNIYNESSFIKTVKYDDNLKNKEAPVSSNGGFWVTIERYRDNYNLGTDPVTGMFYSIWLVSTTRLNNRYEWVSTYTGGMVEGGTYHEHYDDPNFNSHGHSMPDIDTHVEEIILDDNFLNTKADCIYNKLNGLSQSFKDMIKKFDGEFPVAHLKYSIDFNMPDTTNAVTNNSGTYLIEIRINGNTLANRTAIGLARTFAHETIHAELYRKVRSVGGTVSINNFPGIYDYYRRYVKNWQHEQMAGHYRETIVDIIKEFDNNQNSDQFYNDLAWEGLQNTTSWDQLSPDQKIRIAKVITEYKKDGNKSCIE